MAKSSLSKNLSESQRMADEMVAQFEAAGIPTRHVCLEAGVHQDVVGKWRRGIASPNMLTVQRVRDAYNKLLSEKQAGVVHKVQEARLIRVNQR